MREPVTVACAQVEPVLFDRDATIGRIAEVAAAVMAMRASGEKMPWAPVNRSTGPPAEPPPAPSTPDE